MVPYNQRKSHELSPFIKLRNVDGTEDIYYSIFYNDIPNELKNIPQIELNETEEKKRKGIQKLRQILEGKGISGVNDFILLCCLRKCKYNFNKSESQLLNYLKTREMFLKALQQADMKRLELVLDHMVVGLLPYRDKRGRAIIFTTPNINLELFDLDEVVLCYFINVAFMMASPLTSITGVVYIGECKTPSLKILYPIMKKFRQNLGYIASFPVRISHFEVLNEIFIVRWTMNLIRPFLSTKAVERISFYGSNVTDMRKIYHPDLLPEEFGGTMGPLSNTFYKEELMNLIKSLKSDRSSRQNI